MKGRQTPPTREDKGNQSLLEDYTETHPSYAMLEISRVSGRADTLFGSALTHNNFITLRINKGERNHSKYGDRYFGRDMLIEVEMSQVQFAEAITSFNVGSGVPCTLRYIHPKDLEPGFQPHATIDNVKKRLLDDSAKTFKDFAKKVAKSSQTINEILQKKNINKGDRKALVSTMNLILQDINSNIPFLQEQQVEAVDKIVTSAKGEIDAFLTNMVQHLGLEALKEQVDASKALEYQPNNVEQIEE